MSAHSHTHTNRKPSQEQTAEVVSQEDEAECSPDSGYTSVCAVLWDSFDVLFVLHTRIVLHTHQHTVPHPTRLNHLHILIISIYRLPRTNTYDRASGLIPVFFFFLKKKIPCHGWVFGIGATLPVLQGAMKRNPPCSIDFRGETNKKGKTDKPLWLAASRRLEREGKECEGSEQAAIAI